MEDVASRQNHPDRKPERDLNGARRIGPRVAKHEAAKRTGADIKLKALDVRLAYGFFAARPEAEDCDTERRASERPCHGKHGKEHGRKEPSKGQEKPPGHEMNQVPDHPHDAPVLRPVLRRQDARRRSHYR
jgi:hypothetical protein